MVDATLPTAAHLVACVDFDNTIAVWGPLMEDTGIIPGAKEALVALEAAGYRIVIFTSRLSTHWIKHSEGSPEFPVSPTRDNQIAHVTKILRQAGIPFDDITADKIPATVYFDDRAIRVSAEVPLRLAVSRFLKGEV